MSEMLRVRVSLIDSHPQVWRLIEIEPDLTLDQVHQAVQIVMGWGNVHLHMFQDSDHQPRWRPGSLAPRRWGPAFLREDDEGLLPEEDVHLDEVLSVHQPLFYEYDLGDRWCHRLDLIEVRAAGLTGRSVAVVDGCRRCPLDDSGGIIGYEHLLDVLKDPGHAEYEDYAGWVSGMTGQAAQRFDPEFIDTGAINQSLQRHFPTR